MLVGSTNPRRDAAVAYATRLRRPVFPCRPKDKRPLSNNGLKDATTETHIIELWWKNWPDANIGIPTGVASGFDVLDVDPRHGGDDSLETLESQYGEMPATVEQLTGGGGRHLLFRHRDGVRNKVGLLPGLDIRGEGGYIVVAPSVHESGRTYCWEDSSRPGDIESAEWPDHLQELLGPTNGHSNGQVQAPKVVPQGQRNAALASMAGSMRRGGATPTEMEAALLSMNERRCQPPLPEAEVRAIVASVSRYEPERDMAPIITASTAIDWPEPQPLPDKLPAVEPFNAALLPDSFRPWIQDVAERIQCPPDFPAVAAIVALASEVGRQLGIRPKQRDDWTVVPNLWGAVVGRPGVLKTPAVQEPMKALDRLEAEARRQFEAEAKDHEATSLVAEERKKRKRQEIQKALKEDRDPKAAAMEAVEEEPEPVRRRYVCNDTTVEKLGEILNGNPRGVLVYRDELTGFLRSLDRDGREGDRSFYLEAWNGNGRFTYDRIGRGTIDIEAACVSILGSIQPGPLGHYVRRMARGAEADDGLLQRFQMVVYPDLTGWTNHDRTPDLQARHAAYDVFDRLDNIMPAVIGAEQDVDGELPYLRFSAEAQDVFTMWRSELEGRLHSGQENALIEAHLAKFRSLIPSLALLLHLADVGRGPVGESSLRRACAWGEYLESHARRVYAPALSPATGSAHALADRLKKSDLKDGFTLREVYNNGWHDLSSKEEAQEAVDLLEALDWLVLQTDRKKAGGRPKTRHLVHPEIIGGGNGTVA